MPAGRAGVAAHIPHSGSCGPLPRMYGYTGDPRVSAGIIEAWSSVVVDVDRGIRGSSLTATVASDRVSVIAGEFQRSCYLH